MFNKNKKKLSSKVRFQHKEFTGQLKTARRYKRPAVAKPESQFKLILTKLGLGTTWRQILVAAVLAVLFYLIYLPNFLTLQTISITGLNDHDRALAVEAIERSIESSKFFDPQNNLLFLGKGRIAQTLADLGFVQNLALIKKDYFNQALVIEAESKYTKILLKTDEEVVDIYNDGAWRGRAGLSVEQWKDLWADQQIKIFVPGQLPGIINVGQVVIEPHRLDLLSDLQARLSQLPKGLRFDYFDFFLSTSQGVGPAVGRW
ncbi:MAG: hypothetical protein R3B41_00185 [Candidatus Doudnabacteria bacterium]